MITPPLQISKKKQFYWKREANNKITVSFQYVDFEFLWIENNFEFCMLIFHFISSNFYSVIRPWIRLNVNQPFNMMLIPIVTLLPFLDYFNSNSKTLFMITIIMLTQVEDMIFFYSNSYTHYECVRNNRNLCLN